MSTPTIVSGGLSNMEDLGKDESWLQEWLKEQPSRLGLGDLSVADGEPVQDDEGNPAFLATDDERYFSVDVRLGEMDASGGFQLLDNWARNRVRHPDKTHVAVLVTENVGDRYQTTLETLSEHLPLVVVELQVWRGENEAILVPYVSLASDDAELGDAPAVLAASAVAAAPKVAEDAVAEAETAPDEPVAEAEVVDEAAADTVDDDAASVAEATAAFEAGNDHEDEPENKDDTGVADPWGTPQSEPDAGSSNGSRLLSKIGN
jgi:hypothetical protein